MKIQVSRSLIHQIFLPEKAALMHIMPISKFGAVHKIIWWPTKEGQFSVRLACHLEMDKNRRKVEKTSNRREANLCWKAIYGWLLYPKPSNISYGELL